MKDAGQLSLPEPLLAVRDLGISFHQGGTATPITTRKVRFKRQWHTTGIYDRAKLRPGQVFAGPAIVNELSATTVIPPAHSAQVDGYGNLIVRSSHA